MARHIPTTFTEKLREVQVVVDTPRTEAGRHFDYGREVLPGVRLVRAEVRGRPIAFTLWTLPVDVAALCGDGAYPAASALLAIDREQVRDLKQRSVLVDLSQFTFSDAHPGLYYALFDYASPKQVHRALHRLIPQLEPHDGRILVA